LFSSDPTSVSLLCCLALPLWLGESGGSLLLLLLWPKRRTNLELRAPASQPPPRDTTHRRDAPIEQLSEHVL
jgi:hypothetical protein